MNGEFSTNVNQIQISGIRQFYNKMQAYPDALSLTIGQPDFPTPKHIKDAAKIALDANRTTYTPNAGIPEVRQAAAAFVERYDLVYDALTEVITTNGSTEGIAMAFHALLNPGDEVILPAPVYPGYEPLIRLCGATPVYVDTTGTGFKLTPELLARTITDRTKCVLIPYPSNPTGAVLTEAELAGIAEVIANWPIYVLSDEVYSELIYSGRHHSIARQANMRQRTIVINGLSKSHAMTGWRIGFTFAPKEITAQMLKVHQYLTSCASSISQYAAVEALNWGRDDALPMREAYKERGAYVHRRLTEMGMACEPPEGAFYLFPSIAKFGLSSQTFAERLLQEGGVAVVPGDAFSAYGEGFVRISYAVAMDTLVEACNRIENFLDQL